MSEAMIRVNGESEPLAAATLEALLAEKTADTDAARHCGCAQRFCRAARGVARHGVKPGDSVEIVRARQGG